MKNTVIALLAVGCAGCAAVYKTDREGPTARIRFISYSPWQALVAGLADERCGQSGNAGRIAVLGGPISHQVGSLKHQSLGMIGAENLNLQYMHEMEIPAGKPFVYVFKTTNFNVFKCEAAMFFTPNAAQQYETTLVVEEYTCKTTLVRLAPSARGVERTKEEPVRLSCGYPGTF